MNETVRAFIEKSGFLLNREVLVAVMNAFSAEADAALAGKASSLRMIDSHLSVCFGGSVLSDNPVIVIDAGGTNLRVAAVRLTEKGPVFSCMRRAAMPGTAGMVSADEFHRILAAEVDAVRTCEPQAVGIGYCFSYECRALSDHDAEFVAWAKQIAAPEVVGQRVGAELVRRLSGGPLPVVVLNDTVATLLAGLSCPGDPCPGQIGFILGTGTNLACVENGTIRNAESGECDKVPRTDCDVAFDATLPDTGAAQFEKMVSGAYLGGVGLQLLKRAAASGLIAGTGLAGLSELSTCDFDLFASGAEGTNVLSSAIAAADGETAREIARAIFHRAALLTAAHLAAFVRRAAAAGRSPVRITVDGSTYWKVRSVDFNGLVKEHLAALVQGVPFEIVRADEAPMVGAAVATGIGLSERNLIDEGSRRTALGSEVMSIPKQEGSPT